MYVQTTNNCASCTHHLLVIQFQTFDTIEDLVSHCSGHAIARHDHLNKTSTVNVGEWGGEGGKQVRSMNEELQVSDCYNISFIYTSQETV